MARLRLTYPGFRLPPVTCGAGALRTLADLPGLTDHAFFVSGQPQVRSLLDDVFAKVGSPPADHIISKPQGEPTRESIDAGAARIRGRDWAGIVAVGGGSVLDWARLSWAHSVALLDTERGAITPSAVAVPRPSMVLVPSTCASGAEGASVAVYVDDGRKRAVVSPLFLADRVILDGRFLASLDAVQLSASLADALSHAVESILSIVPNGIAKMTAGAALRALIDLADGGTPVASRADRLLEASYLAGGAASHTSVGIAHALAHALAAEGVAHGQGNAVGLVPAILFNQGSAASDQLSREASLDASALVTRLRSIVGSARRAATPIVRAALANAERRSNLAQRMLEDVALRTNPVRADATLVQAYLDLVHQEIESP